MLWVCTMCYGRCLHVTMCCTIQLNVTVWHTIYLHIFSLLLVPTAWCTFIPVLLSLLLTLTSASLARCQRVRVVVLDVLLINTGWCAWMTTVVWRRRVRWRSHATLTCQVIKLSGVVVVAAGRSGDTVFWRHVVFETTCTSWHVHCTLYITHRPCNETESNTFY